MEFAGNAQTAATAAAGAQRRDVSNPHLVRAAGARNSGSGTVRGQDNTVRLDDCLFRHAVTFVYHVTPQICPMFI